MRKIGLNKERKPEDNSLDLRMLLTFTKREANMERIWGRETDIL